LASQLVTSLQKRREYVHVSSGKNFLVFDGFAKRSPAAMMMVDGVAVAPGNY